MDAGIFFTFFSSIFALFYILKKFYFIFFIQILVKMCFGCIIHFNTQIWLKICSYVMKLKMCFLVFSEKIVKIAVFRPKIYIGFKKNPL